MYFKINILFLFAFIVNSLVYPKYSFYLQPNNHINTLLPIRSAYPLSRIYHEQYIRRLKSNNITSNNIIRKIRKNKFTRRYYSDEEDEEYEEDKDDKDDYEADDEELDMIQQILKKDFDNISQNITIPGTNIRVIINKRSSIQSSNSEEDDDIERDIWGRPIRSTLPPKDKKSENFEVITKSGFNFSSVGGYDNIKQELHQCVDLLSN